LVAAFVTFAAYVLAGLAALPLAIPPGYASPLYPAAGVALASVLLFGRRMLPAVALAAVSVNLSLAADPTHPGSTALLLALAIGCGAALQAWAGALLVKRYTPQPLTLGEPREVVAFLLAAAASCLVSPLVGNAALGFTQTVPAAKLPMSVATWWIGDLLGVLIATPVLFTLLGRPREAWAPRRLSVGLTLTLVTAMLALGVRQVVTWSHERMRSGFDRDATSATLALAAQLKQPIHALRALHGVFIASDDVTPSEMQLATQAWLSDGVMQAMGWNERVLRENVPQFEAKVRASGLAGYAVFDRTDLPAAREAAPPDAEVITMRYVEPMATNAAALGVNVLSIPAARAAVEQARRTGAPVATAGFRLTQTQGNSPMFDPGVVIYQAVFKPVAPDPAQRVEATRGVVFVTLRPSEQLKGLLAQVPAYLRLCVVDTSAGAVLRRLAGRAGCEDDALALQHVRAVEFAGRQWELRVQAQPQDLPDSNSADAWLFALVGLLSTAMLGGFLLIVTGRTRRIETAVRERTAALQAEVHDRQVAEAALRESEQRFRNILNSVPIGVVYTDLQGGVRQTNPRYCTLTGYTEAELVSMSQGDYTHPDDVVQDNDLREQLVRGEVPMFRRHKRLITRQGATVWVQATVSLLRDANGKPRSIVGVVEDITEHLKLEEAERAREAAEASNRAKSEFLSRMSHELRTPLNAMLGFAQLLELDQRHPLTAAQLPWVTQIQQAGWHLLEMINDVLDLSRIESGNVRLQIETLVIADLLSATLALVEGDARGRNIRISQEVTDGAYTLLGDATRVKQILTNLLSNAVKYNAESGRVHIGCRMSSADTVEIAVTDTGLGMTPQQLAELFQPFNRLGRERSTLPGTGIGLVISQRLAELMGGTLRARSVAGQGSSFILRLPCAPDPDTVRSDLDNLASEPAAYHRRLVHYVEDNETNVEVMRGILAQRPQVELQVTMTGTAGLAAIRARVPDLLLLDMHLPDMNGIDLLRDLQADVRTAGIPVVVVSADALAQQIAEAFAAGCSHYLTKPVSVSELLAVVDDLLAQSESRFG
jgi:PAS domain S-box-containing protein